MERAAYRQSEVCRMLGIHPTTLWRWIRAGKIEPIKIGGMNWIKREAIEELLPRPPTGVTK